jgi:alpha-tubulin suppressor-like RCC1 family protein
VPDAGNRPDGGPGGACGPWATTQARARPRNRTPTVGAEGDLRAWDRNSEGELGDGSLVSRHQPRRIAGLEPATAVDAGHAHSLALGADGRVRAWGSGGFDQLGDGARRDRALPLVVDGLRSVLTIAAGAYHSLAVTVVADAAPEGRSPRTAVAAHGGERGG